VGKRQRREINLDSEKNRTPVPLVFCIVLNWNGWRDTLKCLASLALQDYERLQIIVVDNGSTDDSITRIAPLHPSIRIIRNAANLGFAGGNNVGIRLALEGGADYVWLLNNDTEVPSNTASKLVAKAVAEPRAGEIGSVFYQMNAPETIQAWGGATLFPHRLYRPQLVTLPRNFGKYTALMAASVLLRRETLMQVGLLDDHFFLDFEDSDLSFRIQEAGWTLAVAEDTKILHKGGASFEGQGVERHQYSVASQNRFIRKHAPFPTMVQSILRLAMLLNRIRKMTWKAFRAAGAHFVGTKR
jgi:GT2 family glycosyltransferase